MAEQFPELYIIQAKEATNLLTNPSFETNTTSWTASGAGVSIARVATYQRRGVYSAEVTTASNVVSGMYASVSLTSGSVYAFSADVYDVSGQTFNIFFADTGGSTVGTATSWTGTGHWVRKSVTYTAASTTTYRVYITRSSVASTTKFYIDGCQAEAGTVSTYLDGDMNSFNPLRKDYYWNGTPHASTSYRSGKTRTGGTLVRVRDYAKILGIVGLGMPPVENNAIPVGASGSQYQNTRVNDREITINLRFRGDTTDAMYDNRHAISGAIKMDSVPYDEPVILRYRLDDVNGNQVSETVDLACLYAGGLEDNTTDPGSQIVSKAAVRFTAFIPLLQMDGENGTNFSSANTSLGTATVLYRDPGGTWTANRTGTTTTLPVYDAKFSPSGNLYAVTNTGGTLAGTATKCVAYWDGAIWNALGTGTFTAKTGTATPPSGPSSIAINAAGSIYIGGNFGTIGSTVINNVAHWNGSNFEAVGTGLGSAGASTFVYDMDYCSCGTLYACGNFPQKISYLSGTTWTQLGTTTATSFNGLEIIGTSLYVYSYYSGGTPSYKVEQYNGASFTDLSIGTSATMQVLGLWGFPSGELYASVYDSAATNQYTLQRYNGRSWKTIISSPNSGRVYGVHKYQKTMYMSGNFNAAAITVLTNSTPLPNDAFEYRNGALVPIDVNINTALLTRIVEFQSGALMVFGEFASAATSNVVTTYNNGSYRAYPRVSMTGPGQMHSIRNYTTGKQINFVNMVLQAGEKVLFDLRPGRIRFESSWRGNMMQYLAAGTDLDFFMIGGANKISVFMTGTDANSAVTAAWQPMYWSIDGVMW